MHGAPIGAFYSIQANHLYEKAEFMYENLSTRFPGEYVNLAHLFHDRKEDLYTSDSIHYTTEGSRTIAEAMAHFCSHERCLR